MKFNRTALCAITLLAVTLAVFTAALTAPRASSPEDERPGAVTIPATVTAGAVLGCDYGYVANSDITYVKRINLARYEPDEEPVLSVSNRTDKKIDIEELASQDFSVPDKDMSQPLVLVIHSHGTEAYIEGDRDYYFSDDMFRSSDTTENVVAVGDEFCLELSKLGISTLHDRTMHDLASYSKAYTSSGASVEEYLEEYPSIRYVIDIHRDAVCYDDMYQRPLALIDGKEAAQVMIVVGTDENGAVHPNWQQNLVAAIKWQQIFNEMYPTLARPVYLHKSSFNQFNMPTMLLLEVGGAANTLPEALEAARLSARALARFIELY